MDGCLLHLLVAPLSPILSNIDLICMDNLFVAGDHGQVLSGAFASHPKQAMFSLHPTYPFSLQLQHEPCDLAIQVVEMSLVLLKIVQGLLQDGASVQ
mmetsp:Transcript_12794/g.12704  ORF Transcript_12794/g.12704 Transcript_12794/m.12704 type:complete len:97 (-) Transcript_12794:2022-2312(-)